MNPKGLPDPDFYILRRQYFQLVGTWRIAQNMPNEKSRAIHPPAEAGGFLAKKAVRETVPFKGQEETPASKYCTPEAHNLLALLIASIVCHPSTNVN